MIAPKVPKPTPRQQREAYAIATARDGGDVVDGGICQRCLRDCGRGVTSRDHRKGRGVGGLTVASNLQVLGGTGTTGCHGWKGANPAAALAEGWSVPSWADPMEWPARRWKAGVGGIVTPRWCLYDDLGDVLWISDADARKLMEGRAA